MAGNEGGEDRPYDQPKFSGKITKKPVRPKSRGKLVFNIQTHDSEDFFAKPVLGGDGSDTARSWGVAFHLAKDWRSKVKFLLDHAGTALQI